MNRLVSILLIFSLLLVQSLPHSHAGSGVVEPGDHASRPHIHLSLHSHSHSHSHGHSHGEHRGGAHHQHGDSNHLHKHTQSGATWLYGVHDHDDDAIYLSGSTISLHRLSANGVPAHFTSLHGSTPERFCLQRTSESEALTPPLWQRSLPIYLLVASLRL